MYYSLDNQLFAALGSFIYIVYLIKKFKDAKDLNKTKSTWKTYWGRNWDDFSWIFFIGQSLAFIQENLFGVYASWSEDTKVWDIYIDNEEIIAWFVGLFGVLIFNKILKLGNKELR